MTICEKRIPIHFASFATVELIDSDLNITAETFEPFLFSFAESRKLNGYLGHGGLIVSRLAGFVENLIQR
ncbi:MAG: hypothetical protein B7Z37_11005 [Verrucomicrobia bacterium 12-59-8]|nr:MAG: hypothetical protein B7Z37_11005 [Verrucomicrobia bacterium 12-59-8]